MITDQSMIANAASSECLSKPMTIGHFVGSSFAIH